MKTNLYRYTLSREGVGDLISRVYPSPALVVWVMLNPSTATDTVDDPTIRKCRGFTKLWGYDAFTVVNLFAFRTAYPNELYAAAGRGVDVVGPENDASIQRVIAEGRAPGFYAQPVIVCAWGRLRALPLVTARVMAVYGLLFPHHLLALGQTQGSDPQPRHPLMMPYGPAVSWREPSVSDGMCTYATGGP